MCSYTASPGFPNYFPRGPLWLRKITTDRNVLDHVNIVYEWHVTNLKIYISKMILGTYEYIPVAYVCNTLHDINSVKMTVAGFVGRSLIRYPYVYTK